MSTTNQIEFERYTTMVANVEVNVTGIQPRYNYSGDDDDEKSFTVRRKFKKTADAFMKELLQYVRSGFLYHHMVSVWQGRMYEHMICNMQPGSLAFVVDYSMNISHLTKKRLQADWWAHPQSSLFPVVAYYLDVSYCLILSNYYFCQN